MNPRRSRRFPYAFLIALALGCLAARAGVSTESPFVPRGQSTAAVSTNTPIELRGMTADEQGMRFAIYDPVKKEGTWVRVDEPGQAFVIRSYDAAANRIVVDYQGKSQTLALVEPKFGPGKTVSATPIMLPGVVQGQTVRTIPAGAQSYQGRFGPQSGQVRQGQAQTQQQTSASEAQRLEAIREEVRRRREARESGGQQQQQAQPQQREQR